MNITETSIPGRNVVWESILDEVPGGVSVDVTRLDYTADDKEYLPAGTPVYVDLSTRVAEVCKSAAAAASGTATTVILPKEHHFKVGDSITDFAYCLIISDITEGDDTDTLTVPSGLITASGTVYGEAAAGASGAYASSLKYTPNGMLKDKIRIAEGNADGAVVKIGSAREDALTFPIPDTYQIALRGGSSGTGTSLITLV